MLYALTSASLSDPVQRAAMLSACVPCCSLHWATLARLWGYWSLLLCARDVICVNVMVLEASIMQLASCNSQSRMRTSAGPVGRLQHQHSSGGQGFSPKVAQQLGLHRPESAQDVPSSADGQAAQSNGPIMTFGQPTQRPQQQPAAQSSRSAPTLCASGLPLAHLVRLTLLQYCMQSIEPCKKSKQFMTRRESRVHSSPHHAWLKSADFKLMVSQLLYRPPSAPEAPAPKAAPAEAAQPAALSELEAQKAYMRQKVQQRQQEAAKQQQQAPTVRPLHSCFRHT